MTDSIHDLAKVLARAVFEQNGQLASTALDAILRRTTDDTAWRIARSIAEATLGGSTTKDKVGENPATTSTGTGSEPVTDTSTDTRATVPEPRDGNTEEGLPQDFLAATAMAKKIMDTPDPADNTIEDILKAGAQARHPSGKPAGPGMTGIPTPEEAMTDDTAAVPVPDPIDSMTPSELRATAKRQRLQIRRLVRETASLEQKLVRREEALRRLYLHVKGIAKGLGWPA